MQLVPTWETIPFHFIWVSITILYGFRVWRAGATIAVLIAVMATTGAGIAEDVRRGSQTLAELTEVPLMAAMFAAMVWHARRRLATTRQIELVSDSNRRLIERQHQFIQDASHELRTPITVALGHAELILRSATGVQHDDAAVVVEELTRLRRLSDRLLLLATADDPDFLHRAQLEVDEFVVETLRRWTPIPRRWLLGGLAEAAVRADPDRLALAIDALVENAVKHTAPGKVIELSVRREGGLVVIAIADTGSGIPEQDVDRLFERFARGGNGADDGRGSGLGLAIVTAIMRAHGGAVRARARPGGGSVFELLLPDADRPVEVWPAPCGPPVPAGNTPSRQV
jgi:signal transduction histidine kinase